MKIQTENKKVAFLINFWENKSFLYLVYSQQFHPPHEFQFCSKDLLIQDTLSY
jgi:hypothetical protein